MKFTRIYTGSDNQSHFEDGTYPMTDSPYGKLTDPFFVETMVFGDAKEIQEVSWHNPGSPCFVIMLEGAMEIEVGDGSRRIFKEGEIVLAEDISGQGHVTRPVGDDNARYLMVTLPKQGHR